MKAANFKAFKCKLRDNTTHSKCLITWAGLAVSVGPASSAEVTFIPVLPILEDPGAASRAGTKSATKVFNHRRRSPWVTTLTAPFPNGQANAGSWLGTKTALYYCAASSEQRLLSSFRAFVHVRYCLTILVRFVHQRNSRSLEFFSLT